MIHVFSPPISVLVVDDEPLVCGLTGFVLAENGFSVITAESLVSAISILKKSRIDVVVTDIQMPNGSGLDLLREINNMKGTNPPVFLVSANPRISLEESRTLGAVGLFLKPVDYAKLSRRIRAEHRQKLATEGYTCGFGHLA